jgi:poly-gamma-glutamate synthesis protein (capsule biosynthesis protein)
MLSRQIGVIIEREGSDFPYALIKERVNAADVAFGNLENPVSSRGKNLGSIFSFRASPDVLSGLWRAGFDVVSLANNHMFDWGEEAFVDTFSHLRANSIEFVGAGINEADAHKPVVFEVGSERIAFLGYTEFAFVRPPQSPNMAILDSLRMREDIERARNLASTVVVSLHWGEEYETESSMEQKQLARSLIDMGATLVIGHHPHVLQEVERYGAGVIAYSLGNFVFDQNFSPDTRRGLLLEVGILDGEVVSVEEIILNFNTQFQPYTL